MTPHNKYNSLPLACTTVSPALPPPIEGRHELGIARSASTGTYVPDIGGGRAGETVVQACGRHYSSGFTLLEILIALFIFAMLALLLSSALHNIIGIQSRTESNADRLHETQLALLMLSRDISQAINRPVFNAAGQQEAPFVGKPTHFTFTRAGVSNANGKFLRSSLQRVRYFVNGTALWRNTWAALDQAPNSAPTKRELLTDIRKASFEYLDSKKVFHAEWPAQDGVREILPRAVKVNIEMSKWGKMSQLYVIAAEPVNEANAQPPKPTQGVEQQSSQPNKADQTPPPERQ